MVLTVVSNHEELIKLIDAYCDAQPRERARAEEHGPLVLFAPAGPGSRTTPGRGPATAGR